MANYPLKVLSILEKNHKFDKLSNLKTFPSATRTAISDKKVNDLSFYLLKMQIKLL